MIRYLADVSASRQHFGNVPHHFQRGAGLAATAHGSAWHKHSHVQKKQDRQIWVFLSHCFAVCRSFLQMLVMESKTQEVKSIFVGESFRYLMVGSNFNFVSRVHENLQPSRSARVIQIDKRIRFLGGEVFPPGSLSGMGCSLGSKSVRMRNSTEQARSLQHQCYAHVVMQYVVLCRGAPNALTPRD